jgi:pantothenate kinase
VSIFFRHHGVVPMTASQPSFALDIGGSLTKVAWITHKHDAPAVAVGGRSVCAKAFLSIQEALRFIAAEGLTPCSGVVPAVGGGAFRPDVAAALTAAGLSVRPGNELAAAVRGFLAVLSTAVRLPPLPSKDFSAGLASCRSIDPNRPLDLLPADVQFPTLLCHVGSGVSLLLVPDNTGTSFERVSGSCLGGSTFTALAALLTGLTDFAEVRRECASGDLRTADLLLRDIYGSGGAATLQLPEDLVAASLGKANAVGNARPTSADLLASIAFMLCNNIAQIAHLVAEKHGARSIVFAGGMLSHPDVLWHYMAFGLHFWSQETRAAMFLPTAGVLGAIGALLDPAPPDAAAPSNPH